MADLLVRLYDLPAASRVPDDGVTIRRALPPERHVITAWITQRFGRGWASEAETALSSLPVTCWLAVKNGDLLGFACHDATAKGFFGPTGVDEAARAHVPHAGQQVGATGSAAGRGAVALRTPVLEHAPAGIDRTRRFGQLRDFTRRLGASLL